MDDLASLTQTLAKRIRDKRDRANLTQKELADELGVSIRTLQGWEAGTVVPRARHRRVLSEFLDTTKEPA